MESISGISPEKIDALKIKDSLIVGASLPRIFAVFFNQSESKVLLNKEIRKALDEASPKEEIIKEVFKGYAVAIDSPIPAGIYAWTHATNNSSTSEERVTNAKKILEKAGWQPNASTGIMEKKSGNATASLSFSISTSDAPELRQVADMLIDSWKKLGAQVEVHVFETGDLNQNVIRPRNFEALLFGEVVGRELDLYPFWHSSQRMDPGLNIALYANSRADKLLSSARSESSSEAVEKNYKAFAEEMRSDIPAVFLYTPNFLYIIPKKLSAVNLDSLTVSQDRFLGVRDWYIETDKVWKIFIN